MYIERIAGAAIITELADRLQERQRFNVANSSANLNDCDISTFGVFKDLVLDFVGDMRNDLDSSSQVIPTAFFFNDGEVDLSGSEVALLGQTGGGVALIVSKIQIGLGAVFGDKYLAMLERGHGAGVNVDIRVHFLHGDP